MSCEVGPLGVYDMVNENAIPQGATWPVALTYTVADSGVYDFSLYTGKLQIRRTYDTPILLELSTENGGLTLAGAAPNVILNFTPANTSPMTTYTGMIYDLELYGPSGDTIKFIRGKFALEREITQ